MRDHLAHRYFDTAHAILQATVDEDLPALELAVTALAESLPPEEHNAESTIAPERQTRESDIELEAGT